MLQYTHNSIKSNLFQSLNDVRKFSSKSCQINENLYEKKSLFAFVCELYVICN